MRVTRIAKVNNREIPVLISDEKEALLAAKAAGRAIVGLWRPGMDMEEISAAPYAVEKLSDAAGEFLERIARRHLGLPWRICETERLLIREMFGDDFDEVWENQIGHGFGTVEELLAYTKYQYTFYEFGFWALVDKESQELVGVAGLKVPEEKEGPEEDAEVFERQGKSLKQEREPDRRGKDFGFTLELGYHIFRAFRKQGYGRESCRAILRYGEKELGADRFLVRISKENMASKALAVSLGFRPVRDTDFLSNF